MPARGIFLQLGAFANAENAENMRARLLRELAWLASPIHIHTEVQLHRLRLGPYPNRAAAERISTRIQSELGYLPTIIEPQPCESCGQPSFPLE
ncbi:MAG: SPOR domain-containing protein [Zoogloeaceae bacterium]|nr:SPOR domain-containing protein [Zoogloeaceae bacterium]